MVSILQIEMPTASEYNFLTIYKQGMLSRLNKWYVFALVESLNIEIQSDLCYFAFVNFVC